MKVEWSSVWVVMLGAAGVLASKAPAAPSVEASRQNNVTSTFGRPVDCADYLMAGYRISGVYEIYPFTCTCGSSVRVWCDMETDGGGWTVFLNRQNQTNQLNFNRTWNEYKQGFGTAGQEYWMGNELLHLMTKSRDYAIRVDVTSTSGSSDYGTYDRFEVDSEDNRYRTTVSGNRGGGTTTSTCLQYIGSRYFTTLDRDYDSYSGNCAATQGGGWWYYNNCRYFNPTSPYNSSINLVCYTYSQRVTNLQIKLRPAICDSSVKTIRLKDNTCGCEAEDV